jgi:hypothetical protein
MMPGQLRDPIHKKHPGSKYTTVGLLKIDDTFDFDLYPTWPYALVLAGVKWGFRAGFWPDSNRESFKIGPSAGLGRF